MKKIVLFTLVAMTMTVMNSCKQTEALNSNIQDTFFGVSFGAQRDEVIAKFSEHNFKILDYSTKDFLAFVPKEGKYLSFGGMGWERFDVLLSNDKFYRIRFYNTTEDKAEAISRGDYVTIKVSAKYKLVKEEPKDSTTYLLYRGKSRKKLKREVVVSVYRYESVGKDIFFGTSLSYVDNTYNTVSDEL